MALRFINTFKKDLENLIVYPEQKTHERSKDQKNAIYYLQNGTKNIYTTTQKFLINTNN